MKHLFSPEMIAQADQGYAELNVALDRAIEAARADLAQIDGDAAPLAAALLAGMMMLLAKGRMPVATVAGLLVAALLRLAQQPAAPPAADLPPLDVCGDHPER